MEAHRVEKIVQSNRVVVLDDLPFEEGDKVEVIVIKSGNKQQNERYPLRGTPYRYEDPFEPVVSFEEWEAFK